MFPKAQNPSLPFEVIMVDKDEKETYQSLDQHDFLSDIPLNWDEDGNSIAGVLFQDNNSFKIIMAVVYEHEVSTEFHNPFAIVKRRLLKLYVRQGNHEEATITTGHFKIEKDDIYSIFESLKIGGEDEDTPYLGIYPDLWGIILSRLNSHIITAGVEVGNERIC